MGLEEDIRTALVAMPAVTAIVGSGANARIRPDRFHEEDGTLPAILVEVDHEDPLTDLTGRGGRRQGVVTITCRASTRAAARALAEAVRNNGTSPGTGLDGYGGSETAFDSWCVGQTTAFVPKSDGSDHGYYDNILTYETTARETT